MDVFPLNLAFFEICIAILKVNRNGNIYIYIFKKLTLKEICPQIFIGYFKPEEGDIVAKVHKKSVNVD